MTRRALLILTMLAGATACLAQKKESVSPIELYLSLADSRSSVTDAPPGSTKDVKAVLPGRNDIPFAEYVASKTNLILPLVEDLLLNKQSGSPGGAAGITNLVSRVAVPQLLGLGVEYGNILQSTTGTTTTLRGNLLGGAQFIVGRGVLPDCFELDQKHCSASSRWLRRFSANAGFETRSDQQITGTATTATSTVPVVVNLFGNGFRMASWGARFDITANNPRDPKFLARYADVVDALRKDPSAPTLIASANLLFGDAKGAVDPTYAKWAEAAIPELQKVAGEQFKQTLAEQLDKLIDQMMAAHSDFQSRVAAMIKASRSFFDVRDQLVRAIQTHQFSAEYTNQHPLNQPSTSNVRLIYSDQPSQGPILITLNGGITLYNSLPSVPSVGRLRDVQAAMQMDRRIDQIAYFKNAVLTFGAYYQWMKDDALITIGPGNVAPGSGIVLPGTAATLLGTKGNIFVAQTKLTIPVTNTIKVPISVTAANRKELINEQDIRGQVGFTVDLDGLLK